jgi:cysteine desulfurase
MSRRVYLDHNATAPLRPEAREAMIAAMDVVGNPSSVHAEGRAAKALMERARAQVAEAAGAHGRRHRLHLGGDRGGGAGVAGRGLHGAAIEHDAVGPG